MLSVAVPQLDDELTSRVLDFLGCRRIRPSARALDRLISAYVQRVPWESVFRILKRQATSSTDACPRLPAEFWQDTLQFGGGGTCYENNYAFMSLLSALGYSGYMTVNDLGALHGNHAAGIVILGQKKYVVDVSIPIPVCLALDPNVPTRRKTPLHEFVVTPLAEGRYQVSRTRHPKRDIYILIDKPVSNKRFGRVMADDYGPGGQFLSHVIIVKMREGWFWRYNQAENSQRIEGFGVDGRTEIVCSNGTLAQTLASHFQMDAPHIRAALSHMSK